jgi:class 3 adenylate cyclase/tetratricopeptide (TPR) repeat protein
MVVPGGGPASAEHTAQAGRLGRWLRVRCPQCERENPGEARFCSHCGAQLPVTCAACGAAQPRGARFCPECGRAVAAASAPAGYTPRHIREQILAVRSAIEGERKQVTVLFCDIVRSSALAAELGPEEFHRAIDRFFGVALAEVHRYEGTINQFLGDGFMALFGAPIAHEDHARRAVLVALGVTAKAQLQIRIGINSGLVVLGKIGDDLRVDYTAFGDTTMLAARLQAAAAPGEVLVSERTAGLVRGYVRLEEVAPVQVKERTVHPLRVIGLGTRTGRITAEDELSPFTGRDHELAELRRAFDVAADGEGQVVGLAGDPGLGKSRLALEFCRRAEDHATVIVGHCLSYGASIPYLPLFELVCHACRIVADDAADLMATKIELWVKGLELDVSLAHYLRHAFGLTAGDQEPADQDPQTMRNRAFDALGRLLVAEAARRPLVVLVEDLHWIDQTSEHFLAEFAGELPSAPIMLLTTCRPGYSAPWTGKSFASQLALRPLSAAASEAIVASALAGGDRAAAAAIARRGEGNPFFLEELARAARDSTAEADGIVPETVQEVLAARIDRLSPDQKATLQLAAVLGREFSLDLAEEVWDGHVPLEALLQELKELEFLRERHGAVERTFVFKHALTRDVAYDGMLYARRRQLHGQAGTVLEQSAAGQRFEQCELLAHHYSRSADPARAIPYLVAAGDRARDKYANEEAIAVYSQAISLIEELGDGSSADTCGAVCESLGTVLVRLSRYDAAIEAYRKALATVSGPLQKAHLNVLCSEAETGAHHYPQALAWCDLAEQALGPASGTPDARWLSSWFEIQEERMGILYWLNDTEGYGQLIERVRPFVESHGSAEQRMDFLLSLVGWSMRRNRYLPDDQTLEFARSAYAIAQADPTKWRWAGFNYAFTVLWHGDLDEAATLLQQSLRHAEQSGDTTLRSRALTYLMVAARKRGDVEGVRTAIGPVIEQARAASLPEYEAMAIANRAWIAWRSGDEETAARDAQAAIQLWEGLPVRYFYDWMALWPLVAIALTAKHVEQAVQYARGMLPSPQQLLREPLLTMTEDAVRAWDSGQPDDAESLLRRATRAAGDLGYL